jgi:hypothetical protein
MVNHTEESQADQEGFADRWQELEKHPERATTAHEDINNFYSHVSRGPQGNRRVYAMLEELATTHRSSILSIAGMTEGYSEQRLDHTQQQFFDDIDGTMQELGMDAEIVEQLVENRTVANGEKGSRAVNEYLRPLYLALRKKGYSHRDLIS